jgi:UDP-N-acetylmuramoylalanine--D-glutamate ligase
MEIHILPSFFSSPKKILIIGAARSGIAAAKFLLKKGMEITLYDDKELSQLKYFQESSLKNEPKINTFFNTRGLLQKDFEAVVLSPGISLHHPLVVEAINNKIPITNEIDLAYLFLPSHKMIGITGSNGKSTTTIMVESILRNQGIRAHACGNLGLPLCELAISNKVKKNDYLVVELSSFQLESIALAKLDAAIIINITPNHLDRYKSYNDYKNAKLKIISLLKPDGFLVCNKNIKNFDKVNSFKVISFSTNDFHNEEFPFFKKFKVKGEHNRENALAAGLAMMHLNFTQESIIKGINSFKPLAHRCEKIAVKNGVTFINDSKATTVVSVERALSIFNRPVHLLLGGKSKGENFSSLTQKKFPNIKDYYIYGHAKEKIIKDLNLFNTESYETLKDATISAFNGAKSGDIILLSPGCASYDQFDDYEHRGKTFRKIAEQLCISIQ